MDDNQHQALNAHFKANRIIFWYDENEQQRDSFLSYHNEEIQKIELKNDEFHVKYLLLKSSPEKKFLVYSPYPKPKDIDNWLLDLNEQHFVFASNRAAGIVQELDIDSGLEAEIEARIDFFSNKRERRDPLKANLSVFDGTILPGQFLDAMLSASIGERRREREKYKSLEEMLMLIFRDIVSEAPGDYLQEFQKYELEDHFFKKIETTYGYQDKGGGLESLLTHLFISAFTYEKERSPEPMYAQAYTFIDRWRNSWDEVDVYQQLADRFEKDLNISGELKTLSLEELQRHDLFKEADRVFLQHLIKELEEERVSIPQALALVDRRKEGYWFKADTAGRLRQLYRAVELYLSFHLELDKITLEPMPNEKLWKRYTESLYTIDQLYRNFLYSYREVRQDFLKPLLSKLEKRYTNSFLNQISDIWHDNFGSEKSALPFQTSQRTFFQRYVSPLLQEGRIVTVICSDALRYEVGKELAERLASENRVQVTVDPLVAMVPSYTQLGMAALLPSKTLEVDPTTMQVRCDGIPANGLSGRQKVLDSWSQSRKSTFKAKAIDTKQFLDLPKSVQQDEIEEYNCLYFYSALIDSTGDNAKSEQDLPDGVEREIKNLIDLTKRIINLNRTHILITADHGFLYQHSALDENKMIPVDKQNSELQRDRRYLVGHNLKADTRFFHFSADQLNIGADFEVQIPRGVVRIRKQGGGSRYVHGGVSLQELAIPVLKIYKSRKDDICDVGFSVLAGTGVITTNQHTVKIMQDEPVEAKIRPISLTFRFESKDGTILTNEQTVVLDSTDENQQNRVYSASFVFSKSIEQYNNQFINLCIYRDTHGHPVPARDPLPYRIQISITPDF